MFNRSKLQKKDGQRATELEEELAKTLSAFENSNADLQQHLKFVYVNSAEEIEFANDHGTFSKYMLVRIPFRSLPYYRKVAGKVVDALEAKFKWPVIIIANRTIQSKRAKTHASQMRPRSRTLKAVHAALLEDIVVPSSVTARSIRCANGSNSQEKVYLDPLDKMNVEGKVDCMAHAYARLTTHKITIDFSKPTSFQKKKIEQMKEKRGQ